MELTPLAPLQASVDYDEADSSSVEHELKQLFIALFQEHLRTKFRRIDHYGYPHLLDDADFETIERFIKLDGLSLLNRENNNQPYMREVFRAWRGQHSRRGLGFLAFYLQMLWPNAWQITQYWHSIANAANYPSNINDVENADNFLTSRVAVSIDPDAVPDPTEVLKMIPTLKRIVPARIVLTVAMGVGVEPMGLIMGLIMGSAFAPTVCMTFEDDALL